MNLAAAYEQELLDAILDVHMTQYFTASLAQAYEMENRAARVDMELGAHASSCDVWDPTELADFYAPVALMDIAGAYTQETLDALIDLHLDQFFAASLPQIYEMEKRDARVDNRLRAHECSKTDDPTELAADYEPVAIDIPGAYEQELLDASLDLHMTQYFAASLAQAYEMENRAARVDTQLPPTARPVADDPTELAFNAPAVLRAAKPAYDTTRQGSYDSTMTAFPIEFDEVGLELGASY